MSEDHHVESYCGEYVRLEFWRKNGTPCGRSEATMASLQIYIAGMGHVARRAYTLADEKDEMDADVVAFTHLYNAGKIDRSRELLAILSEGSKSA